jgi:multidrug resistance efflux pump
MTLTRLIPNGSRVAPGDVVAQFDPVEQIDQARQGLARYEDLSYQVRQREAENLANVERRRSELEQAEAELARALLEVSKAEILPEIEAEQNAIRAEKVRVQLESLHRSHPDDERVDQAALRILQLQRDRQRAVYESAEANLERLQVTASIGGMVALASRYTGGATVRPQEGDQMTRNAALLSIFDPSEMLVRATVAETDGASLGPGLEATVYVDAYPDLALPARFVAASPVAAPSLGSPVKSFMALFRLEEADSRLMPDLSAAVVFEIDDAGAPPSSSGGVGP